MFKRGERAQSQMRVLSLREKTKSAIFCLPKAQSASGPEPTSILQMFETLLLQVRTTYKHITLHLQLICTVSDGTLDLNHKLRRGAGRGVDLAQLFQDCDLRKIVH